MSWRASDGAGVVFSLASSGPDGKGSSSSSPRCIWQQLLFTAGYCTSRSVSPLPTPAPSFSLPLSLSRRKATLASAVKDYPTFSHSTKSSVLTLWPLSHTAPASSCTVQHGPLRSCLLQCFFCSTVMQINPFIYRYVRALEVAECISRDICLRSLETICRVPETLRSVSLSEVKWIFNRGESKINISFLSPPPG